MHDLATRDDDHARRPGRQRAPKRVTPRLVFRRRTASMILSACCALAIPATGCGGGAEPEQIEIGCAERDDLDPYWVSLEADGLQDYDATTAVAIADMQLASEPGSCTTRAVVEVEDGRVDVMLEGRSDGAAYPLVALYIDQHGDGRCDAEADPVWHIVASVPPGETISLAIAASDLATDEPERCAPFE
jgi:hypothetical protein